MPFDSHSYRAAAPFGRFPRHPRWRWLWDELAFCLPMNEPPSNIGFSVGAGPGKLYTLFDVGPQRMGDGGRTAGGSPFHPSRGFEAPSLAGNEGPFFVNGASTGIGTASGLQWSPTNGGGNLKALWAGPPADGITFAFVWSNLASGSHQRTLLTDIGDFFGSPVFFHAINFSPTVASWQVFAFPVTTLTVPTNSLNERGAYVFTMRNTVPRTRSIYRDGQLLGADTATNFVGAGDLHLDLGYNATPGFNQAFFASQGKLDLFLITNRVWSPERAIQWCADPFGFLSPWRRVPKQTFLPPNLPRRTLVDVRNLTDLALAPPPALDVRGRTEPRRRRTWYP